MTTPDIEKLEKAISVMDDVTQHGSDGGELEYWARVCAPLIVDWDIDDIWRWEHWPDREQYFCTGLDHGIDLVAYRKREDAFVAIQCKSRKSEKEGRPPKITQKALATFLGLSKEPCFKERWVVTNADAVLDSKYVNTEANLTNPVKLISLQTDLIRQRGLLQQRMLGPDLAESGDSERMSLDQMQSECIETSVRILRAEAENAAGKSARGKIILPCGTGKTRIALRIIEELTNAGEISAILCPSIALIAQIRLEFLDNAKHKIQMLSVCSDKSVVKQSRGIPDLSKNPVADTGMTTTRDIKGQVTTDPDTIAEWMHTVTERPDQIGIILGTYQSSHKIAEALFASGQRLTVTVADEAHRTAGLKKNRKLEQQIRDFTICHDEHKFPAKYRIYQTATPKVFEVKSRQSSRKNKDWIVRSMDDPGIFGFNLYRKSYINAVTSGWLSDYKIIAIGVNDKRTYELANRMASESKNALPTPDCLRALVLALVMGGYLKSEGVSIKSSISFVNTIKKSGQITQLLQTDYVREWVKKEMRKRGLGKSADYSLQHLDASTKASGREFAKVRLKRGTEDSPHGVLNVGIFGEGVDAPSLSAVGFLESRKSPVDVIQAVGRVMRKSHGKAKGYIVVPVLIPTWVDAEVHLSNSRPEDGWRELGQILRALRAHDSRIEDELSDLMKIYVQVSQDEHVTTFVATGDPDTKSTKYFTHIGKPKSVVKDLRKAVVEGEFSSEKFTPVAETPHPRDLSSESGDTPVKEEHSERIVSGRRNADGSVEIREDAMVRNKPQRGQILGQVNLTKTKARGRDMLNNKSGRVIRDKPKPKETKLPSGVTPQLFDQVDAIGITLNLLEKSGLTRDKRERDVNLLLDSIEEAKRCLEADELGSALDKHFSLDNLTEKSRKEQADGCTIAALILMNALMLHQRIAASKWLDRVNELANIKNTTKAADEVKSQWNVITRRDFLPVLEPAIDLIEEIQGTGRLEGLNQAIRHLAGKAEEIAEHYADLGSDHAGELFNKAMGNQSSDGAYFTRPAAAALLARMVLDVSEEMEGDVDWSRVETWKNHRSADLACGSGTLLAALLTDMKRRARDHGASEVQLSALQKLAVEKLVAGLDINPISLQLAAAQLIAGNPDITYRKIQLHQMPYGPNRDSKDVAAGTLELLSQKALFPKLRYLFGDDDAINRLDSERLELTTYGSDPKLEDAVDAVKGIRVVVMNPPFSARDNMGAKFPKETQRNLHSRVDALNVGLTQQDPEMYEFAEKNSIDSMFVALAERCLEKSRGIIAMINPTIALTATAGLTKRRVLAQRFHIHTILTSQVPNQINLSQNTSINESIIIAQRWSGSRPATRIISLDRVPLNESEAADFHDSMTQCSEGLIPNGWGEVSYWPAEYVQEGDWTAAAWRSPRLARAAAEFANNERLPRLVDQEIQSKKTNATLYDAFCRSGGNDQHSFAVIASRGADGQTTIKATPDEFWQPKNQALGGGFDGGVHRHPDTEKMLQKSGHLLITFGQDISTARLTAVASDKKYVGLGWMPVPGLSLVRAKAMAVFLNSTSGRMQFLRVPGKKLSYPQYNPRPIGNIRVPDICDTLAIQLLAECWEQTKDMVVPQFRDGDCDVRRLWDEAVCKALNWDIEWITELRLLLHGEPFVSGVGYNGYRQ